MALSSLASLGCQIQIDSNAFYRTPCFQAFLTEVEETLELQLIERSAIAISRANQGSANMLCGLTVDALLHSRNDSIAIASLIS